MLNDNTGEVRVFAWGEAKAGLRLGIGLSKKQIAAGKFNTVLNIALENISNENIQVPQSNVLFDYDIHCLSESGKNISMGLYGKLSVNTARQLPAARTMVEIAPGTMHEKNHVVNVDELFKLNANEKYFLQLHLRHWPGKDGMLSSGMLAFSNQLI